eukprot:6489919-Amphidinium_carterae.1
MQAPTSSTKGSHCFTTSRAPPTRMDFFGAAVLDNAVVAGADLLGGARASVSTAAGDVTHLCAPSTPP